MQARELVPCYRAGDGPASFRHVAAYDRAEFMEQRRNMMKAWADYLDQLREGAKIIPLRA